MSRDTAQTLLRFGWSLSWRGPWSRLRAICYALGGTLLTVALASIVVAFSTASLREHRAESLRPVVSTPAEDARALYSFAGFAEINDLPITVILLEPLVPNAPLPPGVPGWPEPGQAVVSAALERDLLADNSQRFGDVAALIGSDGLETPGERRVYIRASNAADLDPEQMIPIMGFGGAEAAQFGYGSGYLYAAGLWEVELLLAIGLGVPALFCLVLGAGIDGRVGRRRSTVLTVLGAERRHLAMVDGSEAMGAIGVGSFVGAILTCIACIVDVHIPFVGATLPAQDTRYYWPALLLVALLAPLLGLGTVLAARQGIKLFNRRTLLGAPDPHPYTRAVLALAIAFATIWATANSDSAIFRTIPYSTGAIIVAILLPSVVAVLAGLCGSVLATVGNRLGNPASIIAGRRLQRFPVRTTRLALGVCFAILALGQVQLWASQLGADYYAALMERSRIGTTVLLARNAEYGEPVERFLDQVSGTVEPVWMTTTPPALNDPAGAFSVRLQTSCSGFHALGLDCEETKMESTSSENKSLQQLLRLALSDEVELIPTEEPQWSVLEESDSQLLLISRDGGDLQLDHLNELAYRAIPGGLQFTTLGQDWVTAGTVKKLQASWTLLIGLLGIFAVTVATGCAMAGDVITSSRDIYPLAAITGRRRWIGALAFYRTALPLGISGIVGALIYFVLPTGLTTSTGLVTGGNYMEPSAMFALLSIAVTLLLGIVVSVITAVVPTLITFLGRAFHRGCDLGFCCGER